ncbi:UNVERIFIED_CONTAM: peptidase S9 [Mumia flava]
MARSYDGRRLQRTGVLVRTDDYTRYAVRYRSDDLWISGILNVPTGRGPYPVVVMAHGYIDPAIYVRGQGLMREQDWLARRGFAVLHTDYRGHAASDDTGPLDRELRLGYTVDVINAVHAVRRSSMRRLDGARVSLLGRSMGGGVVLNALVTQPGLVDAAVVFASVSSDAVDNFERWTRPERPESVSRIERRFGLPEQNPTFWRQISSRTYVDRITEPVLLHHGTSDDSCPYRWSVRTTRALTNAGVDARLRTYEGEEHAFGPQWPQSMRRTLRFLRSSSEPQA